MTDIRHFNRVGRYQICSHENCQNQNLQEANASTPLPVPLPIPGAPTSSCATSLPRQTTYEYQHHVESCACGNCYKARVDSGTQHAYEKRMICPNCKATRRGMCIDCYVEKHSYDSKGFLKIPSIIQIIRQGYMLDESFWAVGKQHHVTSGAFFKSALTRAAETISAKTSNPK